MVSKKRQNDPNDDSTAESGDEKSCSTDSIARTCGHISKSVDVAKLRKALKENGILKDCSECKKLLSSSEGGSNKSDENLFEYDKTLWLCFKCGSQLCGRSKNMHALQHYTTPHTDFHSLALNTTTFQVWCYLCDNEVNPSILKISQCIDLVKKFSQESPRISPIVDKNENNDTDKLKAVLGTDQIVNSVAHQPLSSIPGMAKRIQPEIESLPQVRGLSNLGNTCFFNAVMQCLAQTPYLLEVLKESMESEEEFVLPGGKLVMNDEEIELPSIKGKLESLQNDGYGKGQNNLTPALVETLEELKLGGFCYSPSKLFKEFTTKCPQFKGYDQHDSHECLRQLLESVRCEDLNRYKKVILSELGYTSKKRDSEEMKLKCKFYGSQAADRILRPEPVFRGFLVSTLQCQDCFHTSSCHESFLDLSLPVSVEKSQPQTRHKNSLETSPITSGLSKHQLKKEKEKERKAKRTAKHHKKRAVQQNSVMLIGPNSDSDLISNDSIKKDDVNASENSQSNSSSSSEQSDADVEDNLVDDAPKFGEGTLLANRNIPQLYDPNGNNELPSPINLEKRGDSPENPNKDSNDDENDSGIATSPANITTIEQEMKEGFLRREGENSTGSNVLLELGISEVGANFVMQRSLSQGSNGTADAISSVPPSAQLEKLNLIDADEIRAAKRRAKKKRVRTQSHSDWCTTIAPRYQCEDGECSIQSCLNNFTAVELMTGNNKVGCDECSKRISGEKGKKVYTNATKQFLISSPPAVLILHLKRFQVGPRCLFRKLATRVTFSTILDLAPFCGSKIKNLPNVNRKQKKLLYALYGIVEHSGGMYGGHYTAYVKVRPKLSSDDPRWKFLPKGNKAELDQTDEQRAKLQELQEKAEAREKARQLRISENDSDDSSMSSSSSDVPVINETEGAVGGSDEPIEAIPSPPPGKWYFVSDSVVQRVEEEAVLRAQAYLLFYERIY